MKIDQEFLAKVREILGKPFLYFYFFNVDISLIMYDTHLKLYICIKNLERTVSQIFYIGPGSFSINSRKKYSKKIIESYPFFGMK